MSSGCSCGGGRAERGFEIVDASTLTGFLASASSANASYTAQKVVRVGDRLAVASGTADGMKGCFSFAVFGFPAQACWEILKLNVNVPKVEVEVNFDLSIGGLPAVTRTVTIVCDNVFSPDTCKVTIVPDRQTAAFRPLDACDWSCLVRCAPGCVSCNQDPWCWAACAFKCVIGCCL
jgi:hypothetical protein